MTVRQPVWIKGFKNLANNMFNLTSGFYCTCILSKRTRSCAASAEMLTKPGPGVKFFGYGKFRFTTKKRGGANARPTSFS
jgi:hypothetical protein